MQSIHTTLRMLSKIITTYRENERAVGQRTLQYRGAKYWNDLPNSIKSSHHIHAFTKLLKQHLINNYKN